MTHDEKLELAREAAAREYERRGLQTVAPLIRDGHYTCPAVQAVLIALDMLEERGK